jgi:hypothetical protein
MAIPLGVIVVGAVLAAPPSGSEELGQLVLETRGLRGQMALLEALVRKREEALEALGNDLQAMGSELAAMKERGAATTAGPFLAAPPAASDTVGVAKTAVFAPRVEAEATRRRDTVVLKVRRIEATEVRPVASVDLATDQIAADLPIDQSGALYVVEWSTSEGQSYSLVLKDGATGLPAATAQVKPLQNEGRFLFVGYRVE